MSDDRTEIIDYGDFIAKSEKKAVRAAIWRWKDIEPRLAESVEADNVMGSGRGGVSFVNRDTGDAQGVCRSVNMLVQAFDPGVHAKSHRHSNFAIFIVRQGSGYSIIDGEKIEWEAGDVFFAPAWARHEHCNSSDTERAVLYTVQDVPTVTDMGVWFFQGSDDHADVKHNVNHQHEDG